MPSAYTASREQFEQRMRARRAVTCLAVARSAIASGNMDEAIERLEEACQLSPGLAEAQLLLEELRTPEATERHSYSESPLGPSDGVVEHHLDIPIDRPDVQVRRPDVPVRRSEMAGWSHWVAAAIAICALATLAFLWPSKPSGQDGAAEPAREVPIASPAHEPLPAATGKAPAPGLMAQDQPSAGMPSAVGTGGGGEPGHSESAPDKGGVAIKVTEQPVIQRQLPLAAASPAEAGQAAAPSPESRSQPPAGTLDAERAISPPSRQSGPPVAAALDATVATNLSTVTETPSVATPRPAPPQLPPLQRVPVTDDAPVKPLATSNTEPATAPVARTSDVPAEASLRQTPNDTGAIEGTLRRYADAYRRLDAAAARAVWPTVDQRALARAFEGLESQGIVFEHCDVAVAGDDATAACNGRAQYVPKVGSREPLVERRQWVFRLRKADAGWQITQAQAR